MSCFRSLYRTGDLQHETKQAGLHEQQQELKIDFSIKSLLTFASVFLSSIHFIVSSVQFLRNLIFRRRIQA